MLDTPDNISSEEEKENIIVEILKKLLEINFLTYGSKKAVLK